MCPGSLYSVGVGASVWIHKAATLYCTTQSDSRYRIERDEVEISREV
jgi:hypothetical protein